MKILREIPKKQVTKKSIVTIGSFDGIHLGHQEILTKVVSEAKQQNAISLLITFYPHPNFTLKNTLPTLINTLQERISLIEKTGIDVLIIQEFNEAFSILTARDFIEQILVEKLNIHKIFIGYDHRFGKDREGDFSYLKEMGNTHGFLVEKIEEKVLLNKTISSTDIRKAIELGNISEANAMLGYNFMLTGNVVAGNNLGEKIGFPTANISIQEKDKLIPKTGVYVVSSKIDGDIFYGMMNIGFRPTIEGKHKTIEAHFFNFNKKLYNKKITIEILHFLREEEKFNSIDDLKNQLYIDQINSKKFIENKSFQ